MSETNSIPVTTQVSTDIVTDLSPMPVPAGPRGRRTDTRKRVLDAAIALAELDSGEALGLREVVRRAGLTQGAPYRYFPDRASIVAAVAEYGFRQMLDASMLAQRAGDDLLRRLHALGIAYLEFALAHPGLFRVMFGPESRGSQAVRSAEAACLGLCTSTIVAAQSQGLVVAGDPQKLSILCWSTMHGLASLTIDGLTHWVGLREPPMVLGRALLGQMFEGLRPTAVAP